MCAVVKINLYYLNDGSFSVICLPENSTFGQLRQKLPMCKFLHLFFRGINITNVSCLSSLQEYGLINNSTIDIKQINCVPISIKQLEFYDNGYGIELFEKLQKSSFNNKSRSDSHDIECPCSQVYDIGQINQNQTSHFTWTVSSYIADSHSLFKKNVYLWDPDNNCIAKQNAVYITFCPSNNDYKSESEKTDLVDVRVKCLFELHSRYELRVNIPINNFDYFSYEKRDIGVIDIIQCIIVKFYVSDKSWDEYTEYMYDNFIIFPKDIVSIVVNYLLVK